MDAWKAHSELIKANSTRTEVRQDIVVDALGCERAVRLSIRYERGGFLKPDRWHFEMDLEGSEAVSPPEVA